MADTFLIEDESNVVRLEGTLHDPAATTGDVLTVQADKSIAAKPSGGSQPGLRTVQASYSWADVAARDPAVGVLLATVAANENVVACVVCITTPLTGTDAATADAYVSNPGASVAGGYSSFANNANPTYQGGKPVTGFNGLVGAVYGAFALDADNTVAADLTGGAVTVTFLILGGT